MEYLQTMFNILEVTKELLKDEVTLPIFQSLLLILFLVAFCNDAVNRGSGNKVTRGDKSLEWFRDASNILFALITFGIISTTETWSEYKVILILVNAGIIFYLSYFNGWFRNKIMGIYIRFSTLVENL